MGNEIACNNLALFLKENNRNKEAIFFFEEGCNNGSLASCHELGFIFYNNKNEEKKYGESCNAIGKIYEDRSAEVNGKVKDMSLLLVLFTLPLIIHVLTP